jgi:hypothetical protein
MKARGCITPVSGKNYYVFNKNTKWKMPGARDYITLTWLQDWTVIYTHGESISLLPAEGGSPYELGMYWLQSWTTPDKPLK